MKGGCVRCYWMFSIVNGWGDGVELLVRYWSVAFIGSVAVQACCPLG